MQVTDQGNRKRYHVVGGDEGVVDGDELDIGALERNPGHEPADTAETCSAKRKYPSESTPEKNSRKRSKPDQIGGRNSPLMPILMGAVRST
jgi:hypothetical protein